MARESSCSEVKAKKYPESTAVGRSLLSFPVLSLGLVCGVLVLAAGLLFSMRAFNTGIFAAFTGIGTVIGQTCQLKTVRSTIPTNGTNVALQSYSYCKYTASANNSFRRVLIVPHKTRWRDTQCHSKSTYQANVRTCGLNRS